MALCRKVTVLCVKRHFNKLLKQNSQTSQNIQRWYRQFENTGSFIKRKGADRVGIAGNKFNLSVPRRTRHCRLRKPLKIFRIAHT